MYNNQCITGIRYSRDNWFTCVDIDVCVDEILSQMAKSVYAILCDIAGFGHRSCTPDDHEVAYLSNISTYALIEAYKELKARVVISRDCKEHSSCLIGHNAHCYNEEKA